MRRVTRSPAETRQVAAALAAKLRGGDVVLLHGNLGLGKTCFAQGIAEGLGWAGPVTSPTFSLVQEYATDPPLIHMDLYRLDSAEEIWNLGLEEMLESGAVLLVEWSERCPGIWPAEAVRVSLSSVDGDENARGIEILPPKGREGAL